MSSADFDLAIVGAGFAGSLVALIARRLGHRVVLIERETHPRFAIGESSTPMANLLLEELSLRYDLPRVRPLARWGSWQSAYPEMACGLKRGFTFYSHAPGATWEPDTDRSRELLVAASPNDAVADTHWYRADFDAFLAAEAVRAGAEYSDQTGLLPPEPGPATGRVRLNGSRCGRNFAVTARFVVDATGPRGFLHRTLALPESGWSEYPPLQAVFSHFTGVRKWAEIHPPQGTPPYCPDDAALHHVVPDGWMWVLPFNNGITSAGFTAPRMSRDLAARISPEEEWKSWLLKYPAIGEQFSRARATREFTRLPRLSFRGQQAAGPWWLQLPGAAGFLDPLLSTGFTLTLFGIERISRMLESGWSDEGLADYERQTFDDLDLTAELVGALYRVMPDFPTFRELTMVYFAAVILGETARRQGRPELAPGFLSRNHVTFGPGMRRVLALAGRVPGLELQREIRTLIEPHNPGGLCRPEKRNWYGCP